MPLTKTVPEVFFATMTTFISNSYDAFKDTLTHMKILKLKNCPGKNLIGYCDSMLVDDERLESFRAINPDI